MKVHVEWETDGQQPDLPTEVEVPDEIPDDEVAGWLSDRYGWLVRSVVINRSERA